jgi:hypothetical protein
MMAIALIVALARGAALAAPDTFSDGSPRHCKPSPTRRAAAVCVRFTRKFGEVAFAIDKKYGRADARSHSAPFLLLSVENLALAGECLAGAHDRKDAEKFFDHAMDGLLAIKSIRGAPEWVRRQAGADIKSVGRDLAQL